MGGRIGGRWTTGVAIVAVAASSCGTATQTSPTSATAAAHTFPQTIMILEGHPVPEELTVAIGDRVSFMNHDLTPYTIAGGRDPSRSDCPEINTVGVLASGDTRATEPFTSAKTCDFHVSHDTAALLTGRIIIR
jgi:hypothetical protein